MTHPGYSDELLRERSTSTYADERQRELEVLAPPSCANAWPSAASSSSPIRHSSFR
jgi:predicted glycoside hydrolase/deacetylase ChbG (UPF0249 family)